MTAITRHYDQKSMKKEIVRTSDLMASIKRLFKIEDVVSFYFSQCENRITQDKSSISTDCCDYALEVVKLVNFLQIHDLSRINCIFIVFLFFSSFRLYIFEYFNEINTYSVYDLAFFFEKTIIYSGNQSCFNSNVISDNTLNFAATIH